MAKRLKKIITVTLIILVILVVAFIMILSNMDPTADYNESHEPTTDKTVTIILIDGLSQEIFEECIENGSIPFFQNLINKSIYVNNGIGAFPSMTGYAFYPFITGMTGPHSGIYGLRWFDRSLDIGNLRNYVGRTNIQMNNDISDAYVNLFELNHEYYTGSINTYMNRGVHHSLKTGWAHTTAKYAKESVFPTLRSVPFFGPSMAKDHFQHETLVTDLAIEQLQNNPKVQWITYPSLDAHNHVHGTDETYWALLKHLDTEIGRFHDAIDSLGQKDRMLVVISDHGILDVSNNVDVPAILLEELGLNIERGPSTHLDTDQLEDPLTDFVGDDGYFVINGNLSAYLYMRDPEKAGPVAWRKRLDPERLIQFPVNSGHVNLPSFL